MATKLNRKGVARATALVRRGIVNKTSGWSFSVADGNRLLGDPEDWAFYGQHSFGTDLAADAESKAHWEFPFAKFDGGQVKVFRSGLIAVRALAAQRDLEDIFDVAGQLIEQIDAGKEASADIRKRAVLSSLAPETMIVPTGEASEALQVTRDGGEPKTIVGYAAVFDVNSPVLPWATTVRITKGAFTETIANPEDDTVALFNHDVSFVLGRKSAGTLRLSEDAHGLRMEIDPPNTALARSVLVSIDRGDIRHASIGFEALDEELIREDGDLTRVISKATLLDVSPVVFPRFPGTDVELNHAIPSFRQERRRWADQGARGRRLRLRKAEAELAGLTS